MPADCMLVSAPASARTPPSTAVKLGPCVWCAAAVQQQDTGLFFFLFPSAGTAGPGKPSAKQTPPPPQKHTPPASNTTHSVTVQRWTCFSLICVKECIYLCMDVIAFSCFGERSSSSPDILPNVKLQLCDELYTRGKYISCVDSLEAFGTTHASWALQYFGS